MAQSLRCSLPLENDVKMYDNWSNMTSKHKFSFIREISKIESASVFHNSINLIHAMT